MMDGYIDNLLLFEMETVTLRKYNAIQSVSFVIGRDGITAGTWSLGFGDDTVGPFDKDSVADDIQDALNDLSSLSGIIVTGDYENSFRIEFAGADGNKDQVTLTIEANTLVSGTLDVEISVEVVNRGWDEIGNYVLAEGTDETISANVQPLSGKELTQLPGYDAARETLKIYTKTALSDTYRVIRNSTEYEINNIEKWYGYDKAVLIEVVP